MIGAFVLAAIVLSARATGLGENLARLARLDPKLLYPPKHRGEDSQAHMAIIRSRVALVGCRTQLREAMEQSEANEEW